MDSDSIVYQARLHWVIFFWPVAVLIGGIFFMMKFPILDHIGLFFILISFIWFLMAFVNYKFSLLIVKPKHVILRSGVLVRETTDIPLNKIESIDIRQSIIGSMFKYGSLMVTGTGGTRHMMHFLSYPLKCRRHIEQLMHQ